MADVKKGEGLVYKNHPLRRVDNLIYYGSMADEYMLLADFASYCDAHRRALAVYGDRKHWNQMSLVNIARSGIFAADRSIRDYARDIWHVPTRK